MMVLNWTKNGQKIDFRFVLCISVLIFCVSSFSRIGFHSNFICETFFIDLASSQIVNRYIIALERSVLKLGGGEEGGSLGILFKTRYIIFTNLNTLLTVT